MKKLFVLFLCMILSAGCFGSATVIDESAVPQKKLISIDFPDTPLSTVISVLSIKTGYKFITDGELAKKRIILTLKDVTAEEALLALLDTYNLYYVREGETNIYIIKSKTDTVVTTVSKVFFLNYPTAKSLEPVLKTKLSKNGNLCSDSQTNSIIVTDTADNIEQIDQIIKAIDVPPLQILLEAKIIEITLNNTLDFGIDWTAYRGGATADSGYSQDPLSLINSVKPLTGAVPLYQPQTLFSQSLSPSSLGTTLTGNSSLKVSILNGDMNIQAYIQALKTNTNAKVITNPRLVVVNNKEAIIQIIEEIPYNSNTSTGIGTGVTSTSISFKEVGIKLKVLPQINRDGTIILDVAPEQSTLIGFVSGAPEVDTSKTNTTFMLQNGETAVIGGLVKENETKNESGIPLLCDIPIIGNLFKNTHKSKERTELTVLITAKILK